MGNLVCGCNKGYASPFDLMCRFCREKVFASTRAKMNKYGIKNRGEGLTLNQAYPESNPYRSEQKIGNNTMSNIWALSTGESAAENKETSFDSNNFDPLPHNSFHNAVVTDIKWDEYEEEEYINVTWQIADDSEYKNRKIFHKIKVQSEKSTTRDNAIKMLVTLNNIAEADLLSIAAPTNDDLQRELMGAVAMIKVQVWKIDDKSGNWVSAIGEAGELPEGEKQEGSKASGGSKQSAAKKKFF